ncbi:turripeptide Pal9.2-like [Physella acuta]|uniref:turripeptide Pal9.2-like n=1 Tax=Physella acuta TaxID=109671 RepID=UPI0027DBA632|nr:turripeptide Pal9.2-like [Physella acuta]
MIVIAVFVGLVCTALAESEPCPTGCTFILAPVCGSDGKTYANACDLRNANCDNPEVTVESEGPCHKECYRGHTERPCPIHGCYKLLNPVCGSDGKSYANDCEFDTANCDLPPEQKITIAHCGDC